MIRHFQTLFLRPLTGLRGQVFEHTLLTVGEELSDADYEGILKSVGHLSKGYLKPSLFMEKYAELSVDMGIHEVELESAYVRRAQRRESRRHFFDTI